jgi:hypothetical protein
VPSELCGQRKCRAYHLTVSEFERLGGVLWTQSFRSRLGLLAKKRYIELYGKEPRKIRCPSYPQYRNKVGEYPCGILENAYRELEGMDFRYRWERDAGTHPVKAPATEGADTQTIPAGA